MSDITDLAIRLASSLLETLEPLPRLARSESEFADLLTELGWPAPVGVDLSGVRAPFDIGDALTGIRRTIATGDLDDPVAVGAMVDTVSDLVALVQALVSGPPNRASLPPPFDTTGFWSSFPAELFQVLLIRMIDRGAPGVAALLAFVGVIDEVDVLAAPPRQAYRSQVLDFGNLVAFLSGPLDHLRDQFGWGDGQVLNQDRVLYRLRRLVSLLGPAQVGPPREGATTGYWAASAPAKAELQELLGTLFESYDAEHGEFASVTVSALPIPAKNDLAGDPSGLSLRLSAAGGGSATTAIDLGLLTLAIEGGLQAHGTLVVDLRPDSVEASLGPVAAKIDASVALRRDTPLVLIGSPGGMRVELGRLEFKVGATGDPSDIEFLAGLSVEQLAFIIQASSADSFLGRFLGTEPQSVTLDLAVGWSSKKGFRLAAGGGFRFVISAHQDLLLLRIETITIELLADSSNGIVLNLAIDTVLTLGPVVATVSRVGARVLATPPAPGGSPGNLGPLQLGFGFKPPDGAGVLIDASVVKGGGYVLFDHAAGQYAGILQLSIKDYVTITAIGLIATKMPDGSKGFSLLVILTAEFPPIQLGYGFSLNGLGGIFGYNRTMALDALRSGARTGVLDSILFPINPLARIPKVISDVQSVFPIAPGRFVIGVMARLAWASSLIIVDLGVVIEVPAPIAIAILGRVSIVLPTEEAAVVELHLDIIGIIDLGRGEISVDATLYDSRVAVFNLSGDIAVRIGWGATKMFAVSAGGFNPRFEAPAGFPELRRLSLTLATSDNPLIRLDLYMALTANSVQTGARLDVFAELDAGVLGIFSAKAYLGFDMLLILDPFSFMIDIYGGVDIRRNGKSLLSAEIFMSLAGPQPWHAWGYAEVNFFGRHRIPFDLTMGEEPELEAAAVLDPLGDLVDALKDLSNWTAQLPDPSSALGAVTGAGGVVTLREFESPTVLAHPLGRLSVRQRLLPLDVTIDVYGGAPTPDDGRRFDLAFSIGGKSADADRVAIRDDLPPGLFFALTDDEKLSRPAFEPLTCGYAGIGAPLLSFGAAVAGRDGYETRVVDAADPEPRVVTEPYAVHDDLLVVLAATGAAGRADAAARYAGLELGIAVAKQSYALVSTDDLTAVGTVHPTRIEAVEAASAAGGSVRVVGAHEVAA
jgi:hypothetical protein